MYCNSRTPSLSDAISNINACSRARALLFSDQSDVAVIHHWDADGVASAAELLRLIGSRIKTIEVPKVGFYDLRTIRWERLKDVGLVIIVDYGIKIDAQCLKEFGFKILLIDHHREGCANPSICCNPASLCGLREEEVPATAYLIRELALTAGLAGLDDLAALGIIGDMGAYLNKLSADALAVVKSACTTLGISPEDLARAADIIDACYRNIRYDLLRHAVNILASEGVNAVLHDELLLRNYSAWEDLRESVEALLVDEGIFCNRVHVFRLKANSLVTSYIGRKLARKLGGIIVLVHEAPSLKRAYIYIRARDNPLTKYKDALKRAGLLVGGKDYVLVVTCGIDEDACVNKAVYTVVRKACGG